MKDVKQVIAQLKADESNEVRVNLTVKNVNVADLDAWKRVSLTLNNPVPAYIRKDANSEEYVKGESRVIYVSLYSIAALFSDNEDAAFARKYILESNDLVSLLLSYATVDVIAEHVTEGEEYVNPFSDSDDTATVEHTTFYHHLHNLKIGKKGLKALSRLEDKIIDKALDAIED